MVALATNKASLTGEIANELPDRFSDVFIFVGVGFSGLCSVHLGYLTAIASLLVAYLGTLGKATGAHRDFSGPMSKPWRMVVLHVGAIIALFVRQPFDGINMTTLDWTCSLIIAGCAVTFVRRLRNIVKQLNDSLPETEKVA